MTFQDRVNRRLRAYTGLLKEEAQRCEQEGKKPLGQLLTSVIHDIERIMEGIAVDSRPELDEPESFEWPKCPKCGQEVDCMRTMSGCYRAGCGNQDCSSGYAMGKTPLVAMSKYSMGKRAS